MTVYTENSTASAAVTLFETNYFERPKILDIEAWLQARSAKLILWAEGTNFTGLKSWTDGDQLISEERYYFTTTDAVIPGVSAFPVQNDPELTLTQVPANPGSHYDNWIGWMAFDETRERRYGTQVDENGPPSGEYQAYITFTDIKSPYGALQRAFNIRTRFLRIDSGGTIQSSSGYSGTCFDVKTNGTNPTKYNFSFSWNPGTWTNGDWLVFEIEFVQVEAQQNGLDATIYIRSLTEDSYIQVPTASPYPWVDESGNSYKAHAIDSSYFNTSGLPIYRDGTTVPIGLNGHPAIEFSGDLQLNQGLSTREFLPSDYLSPPYTILSVSSNTAGWPSVSGEISSAVVYDGPLLRNKENLQEPYYADYTGSFSQPGPYPSIHSDNKRSTFVSATKNTTASNDGASDLNEVAVEAGSRVRYTGIQSLSVRFPGATGDYLLATPGQSPPWAPNEDLRVMALAALDDWTPASWSTLIAKSSGSSPEQSWYFQVGPTGALRFAWFESPGTGSVKTADSTVAVPDPNGLAIWLRVHMDVDVASSGYEVTFYTSPDGYIWSQLGDVVSGGAVTNIHTSAADYSIGAFGASGSESPLQGNIYECCVWDRNPSNGELNLLAHFNCDDAQANDNTSPIISPNYTGPSWTVGSWDLQGNVSVANDKITSFYFNSQVAAIPGGPEPNEIFASTNPKLSLSTTPAATADVSVSVPGYVPGPNSRVRWFGIQYDGSNINFSRGQFKVHLECPGGSPYMWVFGDLLRVTPAGDITNYGRVFSSTSPQSAGVTIVDSYLPKVKDAIDDFEVNDWFVIKVTYANQDFNWQGYTQRLNGLSAQIEIQKPYNNSFTSAGLSSPLAAVSVFDSASIKSYFNGSPAPVINQNNVQVDPFSGITVGSSITESWRDYGPSTLEGCVALVAVVPGELSDNDRKDFFQWATRYGTLDMREKPRERWEYRRTCFYQAGSNDQDALVFNKAPIEGDLVIVKVSSETENSLGGHAGHEVRDTNSQGTLWTKAVGRDVELGASSGDLAGMSVWYKIAGPSEPRIVWVDTDSSKQYTAEAQVIYGTRNSIRQTVSLDAQLDYKDRWVLTSEPLVGYPGTLPGNMVNEGPQLQLKRVSASSKYQEAVNLNSGAITWGQYEYRIAAMQVGASGPVGFGEHITRVKSIGSPYTQSVVGVQVRVKRVNSSGADQVASNWGSQVNFGTGVATGSVSTPEVDLGTWQAGDWLVYEWAYQAINQNDYIEISVNIDDGATITSPSQIPPDHVRQPSVGLPAVSSVNSWISGMWGLSTTQQSQRSHEMRSTGKWQGFYSDYRWQSSYGFLSTETISKYPGFNPHNIIYSRYESSPPQTYLDEPKAGFLGVEWTPIWFEDGLVSITVGISETDDTPEKSNVNISVTASRADDANFVEPAPGAVSIVITSTGTAGASWPLEESTAAVTVTQSGTDKTSERQNVLSSVSISGTDIANSYVDIESVSVSITVLETDLDPDWYETTQLLASGILSGASTAQYTDTIQDSPIGQEPQVTVVSYIHGSDSITLVASGTSLIRVSSPKLLTGADTDHSLIEWLGYEPGSSSLSIEITYDGGNNWYACTNGAVLPNLPSSVDGVYVQFRQTFTPDGSEYPILSWMRAEIGTPLKAVSGSVSYSYKQPRPGEDPQSTVVRRTGNIVIDNPLPSYVDPGTSRFKPYIEMQSPSTGNWAKFYVGEFVSLAPPRETDGRRVRNSYRLADKTELYSTRKTTDYFLAEEYRNIVLLVQNDILIDLLGENLSDMNFPPTTDAIRKDIIFPPDTSYLQIMNTCLESVGWDPLTVDSYGRNKSQPSKYYKVSEWDYPTDTPIVQAANIEPFAGDIPNVLVFKARNGPTLPEEGNGILTVRNESVGPFSIAGRGGLLVEEQVEVEASDQADLARIALSIAEVRFQGGGDVLRLKVALNPLHDDKDLVTVTKSDLGVSAQPFWVSGWNITLGDISTMATMDLILDAAINADQPHFQSIGVSSDTVTFAYYETPVEFPKVAPYGANAGASTDYLGFAVTKQ